MKKCAICHKRIRFWQRTISWTTVNPLVHQYCMDNLKIKIDEAGATWTSLNE